MIPGNINTDLISGADEVGYQISRSLRFNSADSAFLSRTPASAGNRKTWTWSGWVKRAAGFTPFYGHIALFSGGTVTGRLAITLFNDTLAVDNSGVGSRATTAVFRDYSAWYHIVVAFDTTNATASDRIKFYINGVQQVVGTTTFTPALNTDYAIGLTEAHNIGRFSSEQDGYFSGYLADIHFIDGQALTPSSFAETNATTGQWVPKAYTGSYGTNGFRLDFSDNSAATAAALGKDTSGNGNNFTPNNLSVTPVNSYQITGFSGTNGGGAFANATLPAVGNGTNANLFPRANNTYTLSRTLTAATKIEAYCYIDGSSGPTIQANGGSAITVPAGSGYAWSKVNLGVTSLSSITLNAASWTARDFWLSCFIVDDVVVYGTPTLGAGNDSLVDTPTSYGVDTGAGGEVRGNYATLNPLQASSSTTLSNGNLDISSSAAGGQTLATLGVSSGKWYFEGTLITYSGTQPDPFIGISNTSNPSISAGASSNPGYAANSYAVYLLSGNTYIQKVNNNTFTNTGTTQVSNGDVVGVAFDLDNGKFWVSKNGTWIDSGNPVTGANALFSGLTGSFAPTFRGSGSSTGTAAWACNFGQRPFAYTAPSGFKALCDTNLPAPVVAKPNTVMDVVLWSGDGTSNRSITLPGGFSPDFVWTKMRNAANQHLLYDAVRGATLALATDNTNAETTRSTTITSFDSSGFTTGSSADTNGSGNTYVAWTWDAGSSTVTNTQGSITSSVRANASSGFSVVTYTVGNNTSQTIGHGLGVAPQLIIVKERNQANNWQVYHASLGNGSFLYLNSTNASGSNNLWNNTSPTSTVFSIRSGGSANFYDGKDHVAYCFAPVAGYSSFGSYTGNGSSDGPFIFLGFRPKLLWVKRTNTSSDWWIYDTSRSPYNVLTKNLYTNSASAEDDVPAAHSYDFVSNGFKVRMGYNPTNNNGDTYIYAAFAENPFQYARAR